MSRPDDGPGAATWLLAFASMALPWAGAALALAGIWLLVSQGPGGGWLLAAGAAMLLANVLADRAWSSARSTDEPDLNQRHAQLVGRSAVVAEPIVRGRGKVRVDDTLWPAEGPDLPSGTPVRIAGARGGVLVVAPA